VQKDLRGFSEVRQNKEDQRSQIKYHTILKIEEQEFVSDDRNPKSIVYHWQKCEFFPFK